MFEQASMLDSMALAKRGRVREARDELKFLAIQSLLAGLPEDYRATGDLLDVMQLERSFFHNSLVVGDIYLQVASTSIKQKIAEFGSSQKTDEDRQRIKGEIEALLKGIE
jgi:hypothetical protein